MCVEVGEPPADDALGEPDRCGDAARLRHTPDGADIDADQVGDLACGEERDVAGGVGGAQGSLLGGGKCVVVEVGPPLGDGAEGGFDGTRDRV